jgi:GDP-L-fucose synthase
MMNLHDKIYVAGHRGLVGSSICRLLSKLGYTNILTVTKDVLDLTNQSDVNEWFAINNPDYVFLCAAKVGGILHNKTYPADFMYENLMIQTNVIHASYLHNVKKLLFLGSSCIYPKDNELPIKEGRLLCGPLESTNEAYSLAKIAGLKMCEYYYTQYGCNFISAMPCNIYGPHDCFDLNICHVIPALISKFHTAKINNSPEIVMWGSGIARREFMYVDDLSDSLYTLMCKYEDKQFVNVGTGLEITMKELFDHVSNVVNYTGSLVFDSSKPDGIISKLIDITNFSRFGTLQKIDIESGLRSTYRWYLENIC